MMAYVQIFLSLFSVLRDRHAVVTVELKNDIELRGTYPTPFVSSKFSFTTYD